MEEEWRRGIEGKSNNFLPLLGKSKEEGGSTRGDINEA